MFFFNVSIVKTVQTHDINSLKTTYCDILECSLNCVAISISECKWVLPRIAEIIFSKY